MVHTSEDDDIRQLDLSGKVDMGERASCGGYSDVWRGNLRTDIGMTEVAIKQLRIQQSMASKRQLDNKDRLKKRCFREVLVWRRLQHLNIVPLLGYTMDEDGIPALISPWYSRGNVIQYLESHPKPNRSSLALDAAEGLKYLHSIPVLHGDLKGENVLVNGEDRASLCDFGMSQFIEEAALITGFTTTNANPGGTDRFLSPELLDDKPKTVFTDIWAFGCLIGQILTGRIPYEDISRRTAVILAITKNEPPFTNSDGRLDNKFWSCLAKCWSIDPDGRPAISTIHSYLVQMQDLTAKQAKQKQASSKKNESSSTTSKGNPSHSRTHPSSKSSSSSRNRRISKLKDKELPPLPPDAELESTFAAATPKLRAVGSPPHPRDITKFSTVGLSGEEPVETARTEEIFQGALVSLERPTYDHTPDNVPTPRIAARSLSPKPRPVINLGSIGPAIRMSTAHVVIASTPVEVDPEDLEIEASSQTTTTDAGSTSESQEAGLSTPLSTPSPPATTQLSPGFAKPIWDAIVIPPSPAADDENEVTKQITSATIEQIPEILYSSASSPAMSESQISPHSSQHSREPSSDRNTSQRRRDPSNDSLLPSFRNSLPSRNSGFSKHQRSSSDHSSIYSEEFPVHSLLYMLLHPELLAALLQFFSFREFLPLLALSKRGKKAMEKTKEIKELILENFLGHTVGYERWGPGRMGRSDEPLSLTLKDLNLYMRGRSVSSQHCISVSTSYIETLSLYDGEKAVAPESLKDPVRSLASSSRAYTRVVLRLRAQADAVAAHCPPTPPPSALTFNVHGSDNERGRSRRGMERIPSAERAIKIPGYHTSNGSISSISSLASSTSDTNTNYSKRTRFGGEISPALSDMSRNSSGMNRYGVSTAPGEFKSPLYRTGRAALLKVYVPSKSGWWLDDSSVVECEKQLKRAGVKDLLRVGDVVWDIAAGNDANVGRMIWDGTYLLDLDYSYSEIGEMPRQLDSLAFSPSYWHKIIRKHGDPICHIDLSLFSAQVASTLQLLQDRVWNETPQGDHHTITRWIYRARIHIRPGMPVDTFSAPVTLTDRLRQPVVVDSDWVGTLTIEAEGTSEGLADLQNRCGDSVRLGSDIRPLQNSSSPGRSVFRLLREKSRPGDIWLKCIQEKERI